MENPFKNIKEKIKKTSNSKLATRGIVAASVIVGGLELSSQKTHQNEIEKNMTEANEYSLESRPKRDLSQFLTYDFIKDVAISNNIKKYSDNDPIKVKNNLIYSDSVNIDGIIYSRVKDKNSYVKKLKETESLIKSFEKFLEKKDIVEAKNKIIAILISIEQAKLEVIRHIQSDKYLEKLSKEMNISKDAAKLHQKVRINNIKNLSYQLQSGSEITGITHMGFFAYYLGSTNEICLPYDVFLEDINMKNFFYETLLHEILHESTQYEKGMSDKSIDLLLDSHKYSNSDRNAGDSAYFFEPGELIVRKQILDLEMEKLGVKKYGEKFTNEHNKKLLELKEKGELSSDAVEFIEHIKPEKFSEVMNELAENKDDSKTYYHPEWNYDDIDNKA